MEPWRGQEKLAVVGAQAQPLHWGRDRKGEGRGVYTYPDSAQSGQLTASYMFLLATHVDQNSGQNDSCYFPQSYRKCMIGNC